MELLSVFDTPELYTVLPVTRNSECSTNSVSDVRTPSSCLVGDPGESLRSIQSTESRTSNRPKICPAAQPGSGSSQGLSFEICQAMRQILLNSNTSLSRRAAEHLELLSAQGTTDPSGTVLRPTRTGCEWWTYAGLKANAALVQSFGLPATFDSLTIRARCCPSN